MGGAITRQLRGAGYTVAATFFSEPDGREEDVAYYQVDVRSDASIKTMIEMAQKESGLLDALVYAPGSPLPYKRFSELKWADVQEQIDVHARGLFNIAQGIRPQLKKHPLRLVVILTEACFSQSQRHARMIDYILAKQAQMSLAKSLAAEFSAYHSTVNMVSPGLTKTALVARLPERMLEAEAAENPMQRITTPDDVAGAVVFLLSDAAAYISGENIMVNGGNVMQ